MESRPQAETWSQREVSVSLSRSTYWFSAPQRPPRVWYRPCHPWAGEHVSTDTPTQYNSTYTTGELILCLPPSDAHKIFVSQKKMKRSMQLIDSTKHLNALDVHNLFPLTIFHSHDSGSDSNWFLCSQVKNTSLLWDLSSCACQGHLCSLETWLSRAVNSKLDIFKWWMWKSDRNISNKKLRSSRPLSTPLGGLVVRTWGGNTHSSMLSFIRVIQPFLHLGGTGSSSRTESDHSSCLYLVPNQPW